MNEGIRITRMSQQLSKSNDSYSVNFNVVESEEEESSVELETTFQVNARKNHQKLARGVSLDFKEAR